MFITLKKLLFKRKILMFFVLILGVIGLSYKFWPAKESVPESPMLVEVEVVQEKTLHKTVMLSAVVNPKRMTLFQAQEKGVMGPLLVKSGSLVKQGTLLAEMRNLKWYRAFKHAKKKASLEKKQFDRLKKLVARNNKSQRALDIAHEAWLSSEISLENTKKALARTQFKAPYDGQVGVFKAREGQFIRDGDDIVVFYDTSEYVLDIDVPDSLLHFLKVGNSIKVKDSRGAIAKGVIESIQMLLDPKTHMGLARAILSATSSFVFGERIRVEVDVVNKEKVISLPRSAVFLKDRKTAVYQVVDGKVKLSIIKKGIETAQRIEILEGLKVGEQIIIKGQGGMWPTKEVKIFNSEKSKEIKLEEAR